MTPNPKQLRIEATHSYPNVILKEAMSTVEFELELKSLSMPKLDARGLADFVLVPIEQDH